MSNRQKYLLLCGGCLVPGCICYAFFRPDTYIAIFLRKLPLFTQTLPVLSSLFLQSYLPDLLWGLALSLGLMAIYDPDVKGAFFCSACSFACGCIWEALQFFGSVRGTGDLLDVLMYLFGSVFSMLLFRKVRNET